MLNLRLLCATLLLFVLAVSHSVRDAAHASMSLGSNRATSLCASTERIVWSCEVRAQRKWASICGSKDLDKSRGYLQYRFGRPNQIELEFPRERTRTQTAFQYFRYTRPRVTHLAVRFENGGATYTIYHDDNSEEGTYANEDNIEVKPAGAGAKEQTLRCRMPVTGTLMNLEDVGPFTTKDWL